MCDCDGGQTAAREGAVDGRSSCLHCLIIIAELARTQFSTTHRILALRYCRRGRGQCILGLVTPLAGWQAGCCAVVCCSALGVSEWWRRRRSSQSARRTAAHARHSLVVFWQGVCACGCTGLLYCCIACGMQLSCRAHQTQSCRVQHAQRRNGCCCGVGLEGL